MKKIENSIFKAEKIKKIDINDINLNRINNSELNSFENESNNNIKIEDNEEEIKFDDILNEINKDEEILLFDDENDKIEKKIIEFFLDTPMSKISKEEFENLEKKFNEDYALKYIVDKMKNKINKNDLIFKYELIKSNIKGYFPNNKNLYHEIESLLKEGEKLSFSSLFENSKFLSSKIIATVSQINSNEENEEIPFNKIEANILIDLARTISNENRFFNMLMVCGLAYALYSLKISYTLNIIGDSDMKVRVKNIDEPHSELIFQKLYDCCFIKDDSINRVYYIFTNGFDEELKKCRAWQNKIFNEQKNSFAFIFIKSQVLEKQKNFEYKKYLEEIWNEFAEESKNSNSIVTVTKTSLKEIDKLDYLIENLSKVLLREKDSLNKNSTLKVNLLFNVDKSSILSKKYIDIFRSLLNDQLNFC